jgi:ubiquinone/menaquinone biosynthesis C-methylase UbiE/uncharacterized protein YbaR (Trm112 family)
VKHRAVDLLQCPCGGGSLALSSVVSHGVPFGDSFDEVRCQSICTFKSQTVGEPGGPTPADCTECYGQEISEGTLTCSACGRAWPIVGGIPRFIPDNLAADVQKAQDTFSYEWKMFRFGERNWGQDIEHRKQLFLDALGASPDDLRGKLILDAGCGSGALAIEMARSFGMEVLALDLAFGIEQAYQHNDNPYVHFVQGSVLDLPVQEQRFDYLYCAGVLVATPDTGAGFREIIDTLRPGGRCFIWVYHPIKSRFYGKSTPKLAIYNWIRVNITSKLPIRVQYGLYLTWIPFFLAKQSAEVRMGRRSTRLTWREKMQSFFDFFSPKYQNRHDPAEVSEWFADSGFESVTVCNIGAEGFGVRGDLKQVLSGDRSD